MVKPEWGTKRTCPKCSTRFYDLGVEDPVHCIELRHRLRARAGAEVEAAAGVRGSARGAKEPAGDDELAAEDLAIDEDAELSADEEVDLETGDDDLGVETAGEDDDRRIPSKCYFEPEKFGNRPGDDKFPLFQREQVRLRR